MYKFYQDSGHGWLAVSKKELKDLGLNKLISQYSYMRGNSVYLEEDLDMSLFFKAFKERYGYPLIFKTADHGTRSTIRRYERYKDENIRY